MSLARSLIQLVQLVILVLLANILQMAKQFAPSVMLAKKRLTTSVKRALKAPIQSWAPLFALRAQQELGRVHLEL